MIEMNTANEVRLGIFTDDTPVSDNILASGMCRVNSRLFRAINEQTTLIMIRDSGHTYYHRDVAQELQSKSIIIAFPKLLQKFLRQLLPKLDCNDAAFQLMLPSLARKLHQYNTNWLFCPCGVNPFALERGFRLAKASRLPLAVYLVDDFLSGAVLSGNETHLLVAQRDVPRWLSNVEQIFVISEGLRRRIQELYDLDSEVLSLPYDFPKLSSKSLPKSNEEQIIFVGNLSHFYIDGLRQIAAILDDLNRESNSVITLRLTLPDISQVKSLIGNFDCIRCSPCENSESLHQEIASSLLCFAPYSFQPKYKEMVATSFPSKMLDYLAFGKFIVTYAPEYASSILYFEEHGLSTVLCSEDTAALRNIVLRQLIERQDYSKKYREVIHHYHSSKFIAEKIILTLNNR